MAYDPQGALNGLFAPAYIPGNQQSVDATTAWNANRQTQLNPATPPASAPSASLFAPPYVAGDQSAMDAAAAYNANRQAQIRASMPPATPPAVAPTTTPFNPVVGGRIVDPFAMIRGRLPPAIAGRLPPAPAPAGGSFTFTEPTLPSVQQPGPTSVTPQAPFSNMRNQIAQTLMNRRV
jgi:hypothetical protein